MAARSRLILAAALALALLLTWGAAGAQEPPKDGTRLEPDVNLVGWVGEATPVSRLFDEIPQLESIWTWDAELRDWIAAGRGAPEWLGGLGRVTPGMGLRMQLGGGEPFDWQRSTEPTRGLVKLRAGWNLVAWSGADETPIDDVVKGIGWSLRSVRRWDAANQQWAVWTSPERTAQLIAADNTDQETDDDSETSTIRRGEALWINVARAVNWLQPTDILPRLIFPGGASPQLQIRVREDLEAVLSFYRTQYGIQADPDFTIYVAKDVDALIKAWRDDGEDVDEAREASTRTLWDLTIGWAGGEIVVKQAHWPKDPSGDKIARGRYHITHEYFHILQRQLSDGWASQWLVEGTADWVEGEHKVLDGERTLDNLRDRELSEITDNTPTLRSTEEENAQWEYTLGWLATDQLTANTAPDFPIEFWRQSTPTEIGPHGRWASTPDWRTVFHRMSGQTMSDFYTDFDAWQQEQAAANPASASPYDDASIRGRVTGDDDAPVAGVFVNAIRVEGETSVGWNQRAETDADGAFAVRAPQDGDYRLSVDITDDCTRYYSDGRLIDNGKQRDAWQQARRVSVSQSDVSGIDIQVPPGVCGWQIRGRVVGPVGEPLAGVTVMACPVGSGTCTSVDATTYDGSFAVSALIAGEYRLYLELVDGCGANYLAGGATVDVRKATPIKITDGDIDGLWLQVPAELCSQQISGRLLNATGQPLADTRVEACLGGASGCAWTGGRTDGNGAFAIIVPVNGSYRIHFIFEYRCTVYLSQDGLTISVIDAQLLRMDGRDVQIPQRQVSAGLSGWLSGWCSR